MKKPDKRAKQIKPKINRVPTKGELLAIAFLEGSMVLAVEILGAKMITPYFGTSHIVWTSVIAITLTSLTVGYFLGGKISEKKNPVNSLFNALIAAALFMGLMPIFVYPLLKMFQDVNIYMGSMMSSILLLSPPLILLGTTSPMIIQIVTSEVENSGKFAGFVYAISTVGGIMMTFMLGFFIIPAFGIGLPVLILAIVLLLAQILIFFDKKRLKFSIPIAVLFLILAFNMAGDKKPSKRGKITVPFVSEGLLGQLKVLDKIDEASNYPLRHLLINGIAQTRIINNASGVSYWKYIHKLAIYASLKHHSPATLLFGFGAGSVANEMNRMGQTVDAVEIDERMLQISKDYFYFNDSSTTFIVDDARHYIKMCKKKYDMVIFDIANGEVQPSYVFTTQSFGELKKMLNPNGIIVIEFQEFLREKEKYTYKSIYRTLEVAGYQVRCSFDPGPGLKDIVIIASPDELDLSKLSKDNMTLCCKNQPWLPPILENPGWELDKLEEEAVVFSDDKPILDHMNAESIKMWRENMLEYLGKTQLNEGEKMFQ